MVKGLFYPILEVKVHMSFGMRVQVRGDFSNSMTSSGGK